MSKCPLIAKAIVYAVRQSTLRHKGVALGWDDIEVNTNAILAGHPVPSDGVVLPRPTPDSGIALKLADKLKAMELHLSDALKYVTKLEGIVDTESGRVADEHQHMLTRCRERDEARQQRDTAVNKVRELRADLDEMGSNYRRINGILQDVSQDLTRMTKDRDGFRKSAKYWLDEANTARAEVENLIKVLSNVLVKHGIASSAADAARAVLKTHGITLL